jgi:predicted nuclease with RNAse H fold
MPVLSVDLAHKRWGDIGLCSLEAGDGEIVVEPISLPGLGLSGAPTAAVLAEVLADLAARSDARLVLLDGPQAWKDPANGIEHCRLCERELATQGKTGLPGFTKPAGYLGFIAFAIDVFDRLAERGWPRLPTRDALGTEGCFALECFPTSAWRRLGLAPLPGKANRKGASVAEKLAELQRRAPFELRDAAMLSHDELQAVVAGLAGLAAEGHPGFGFDLAGVPPFRLDDIWREGFIVNPKPW